MTNNRQNSQNGSNPYGMGHTTLKYGSMYIGNIHWKHTLETLPFGNIILFWKQIFITLERYTEYWKKCRLETKSV